VSLYQNTPPPPVKTGATAGTAVLVVRSTGGPRLVVVSGEAALHRDAVANARQVGRLVRGQQVTYLDSIDRRLQVFRFVVFDGGHWIKVRAADGTEGWVPAETVRELP
jgi:hypothetical protein